MEGMLRIELIGFLCCLALTLAQGVGGTGQPTPFHIGLFTQVELFYRIFEGISELLIFNRIEVKQRLVGSRANSAEKV
ncbi:hypothetical protein D3C86_1476450 [compost metagenome]